MASLGSLIVELKADLATLRGDMAKGVGIVESASSKMRQAAAVARTALAGIAAGVSIAGITGLIRSAANAADEMGKLAQRSGVATETLSALGYAAKLSDVDMSTLGGSLQRLSKQIVDAAGGGKESAEGFAAIGVAVTDAAGQLRNVDAVFADVAEAISRLPDGTEKTALALRLFGRAGAEIIPLLNEGREGLAAARKEAEEFGLVISGGTAKAAAELNDNMTRLNSALQGFVLNVTGPAIDGLANLTTEFVRAYTEADGLLRVFTALGTALSRLASGTDQEQLGELLEEQRLLERRLRELGSGAASNRGTSALYQQLTKELADVNRQITALQTVMDPAQFGAAPARGTASPQRTGPGLLSTSTAAAAEKAAKDLARDRERAETARRRAMADADRLTLDLLEEEARAWENLDERRRSVIEANMTPLEQQLAKLKEIRDLVGDTGDTYGRAAIDAFNELNPAIDLADDKAKELLETFADLGATFSSAFEDAIFSGGKFSDVLDGLAQDIARITLRKTVSDPLANLFSGFADSASGGIGNFFKGLFANSRGGLYKVAGSGGGERPVAFTARAGEVVAVGTGMSAGGDITIVNTNGPPIERARRSVVNGRHIVHLTFVEAMGGANGEGMLMPLGISPPLVAR